MSFPEVDFQNNDGYLHVFVTLGSLQWKLSLLDQVVMEFIQQGGYGSFESAKAKLQESKTLTSGYFFVSSDAVLKQGMPKSDISTEMIQEKPDDKCHFCLDCGRIFVFSPVNVITNLEMQQKINLLEKKLRWLSKKPDSFVPSLINTVERLSLLLENQERVQDPQEKKLFKTLPIEIPYIQHGGIPTASSEYDTRHGATYCMMNRPQVTNSSHAWCAKEKNGNEYLQVFFAGFFREVTRVEIQGRGDCDQWPLEVEIQGFAQNGQWEVLYRGQGVENRTTVRNILSQEFTGTSNVVGGLRIYIRKFHSHPSMRCEVWVKGMQIF